MNSRIVESSTEETCFLKYTYIVQVLYQFEIFYLVISEYESLIKELHLPSAMTHASVKKDRGKKCQFSL
jgi:hypothetical protein